MESRTFLPGFFFLLSYRVSDSRFLPRCMSVVLLRGRCVFGGTSNDYDPHSANHHGNETATGSFNVLNLHSFNRHENQRREVGA